MTDHTYCTWMQCQEEAKLGENRTFWYGARVLELLTQQCAESLDRVTDFVSKQVKAVRYV